MRRQKLVLIGNGMAGGRCIENIIQEDDSLYDITIFGKEPHVNYSRIMLSAVLQGDTSLDDITINDWSWYKDNNIELYTGETITEIDKQKKLVRSDKDRIVYYDKLILATGSEPVILPLPGVTKEGVISFRTIQDCNDMIDASKSHTKAIVIGAGLLGLEAARGLLNLGMEVDVVHLSDRIMNKQLDGTASRMLQKDLENQGMNFLLDKASEEIIGDTRAEGIRFSDGTVAKGDLIVMAVGVKPNIALAKHAGIDTNRGILVNNYLETTEKDIYAVGECAEHKNTVYGLVKPLYEQGAILAKHLCQKSTKDYQGSVLSTHLKIAGVDVFSVGDFTTTETTKTIQIHDEIASTYKKIFFKENKAVGAVLFGNTKDAARLLDLIIKKKFIPNDQKANLLQSYDLSTSYAAVLPKEEYVCTCNNVPKGVIVDNVLKHKLQTVQEVKACTKASSSCGGCKPVVSELLAYMQSDHFQEKIMDNSFCACTKLSEEEVVTNIQRYKLTSVPEIIDQLGWTTQKGCKHCVPALQYYVGMIYPEYDQQQRSLYLNEKMNAIACENGTYSVVPQLYGGIIDTEQLQKIVNTANKYGISQLSISSDQRIHIRNIDKEDLSSFWQDLNMRLHSVAANMVQHVKTTNNDQICSCDKHHAIQLAEGLEKRTEFLNVPYRFRIGVSACMHNGAGSTTKDIGAIKIDRGWEIYVGGSSGRNARSGQLLTVAKTEEDAIKIMIGFIQYYRDSANFQERTWQWISRVSIVHIREVLFNEDLLNYLVDRLKTDLTQRKHLIVNR
ncbi:nitrite reductase large subunit NirB [Aquibacillus koreensis]|uniref:Nitrite reductase large subunit NirB n=1 Tax=Aquibacillus koreensis TaxID=279446 RepID=A0A9X4AK91_9BACI|nr:nitrite reductase large subunit NirB [Aquibacillus koreensis]MCT2537820.1 nitrite reductase large subunit NirB [Aquibacillus koreensis]MDC3421148.1 nitrite reductase large subunit NirB [Aquibacillus koreensis]